MKKSSVVLGVCSLSAVVLLAACTGRSQPAPEVPESEITASVPELEEMHQLVYPLWHDAFPNKNYEMIGELVPQFEEGMAALEEVSLPGILREKQTQWEDGKGQLKESFAALKTATEAQDHEGMLEHTEAFHMLYERLVRVLRPVVQELEAFHQEMYRLYHYFMPAYDLDKIRETVTAMQEKLEPLRSVQLPSRLSERQDDFEQAIADLSQQVEALAEELEAPSKRAVNAAIEAVHTAYQGAESIFD